MFDRLSGPGVPCVVRVERRSWAWAWWACGLLAGCGGGLQRGAPLADPAEIAVRVAASTGVERPARVVFEWEYVDARGNLRGDGAGRVNPPDRFRLDLFSTGEGAMSAALVDDRLTTTGDLEDVRLPPTVFLYAMAGVFRPGSAAPIEGFESGELQVLGFPADDGSVHYFYLAGERLTRLEARRGTRLERRVELSWGEDYTWPREARYRDDIEPTRVRWELSRVIPQDAPFGDEIFDLDRTP